MKIVSARLVVVVFLMISLRSTAQNYEYIFSYSEKIVSDYSFLTGSPGKKNLRNDSSFHEGRMAVFDLRSDSIELMIRTDKFYSTGSNSNIPSELRLIALLDENFRVQSLLLHDSIRSYVNAFIGWLGEINFRLPGGGKKVEKKVDGNFNVQYSASYSEKVWVLAKTSPEYFSENKTSQGIWYDRYNFTAEYPGEDKFPNAISLFETKRQLLGRKTLACIQRHFSFSLSGSTAKTPASVSHEDHGELKLYSAISESERKQKIARSLVAGESWPATRNRLKNVEQLTSEEKFRLKSLIRSFLILQPDILNEVDMIYRDANSTTDAKEIIETAIAESTTVEAEKFLLNLMDKNRENYSVLKRIIIKLTTADAITVNLSEKLMQILKSTSDADMKNLLSLALSNYSLPLRDTDQKLYETINDFIHDQAKVVADTLQYLYLVGNAGYEKSTPVLVDMLNSSFRDEVIFAFRHFRNIVADTIVSDYILENPAGGVDISTLLANRRFDSTFLNSLTNRIISADEQRDSSYLPVLKYLLDHSYELKDQVDKMITHTFFMKVYRQEIEDYLQSNVCLKKN